MYGKPYIIITRNFFQRWYDGLYLRFTIHHFILEITPKFKTFFRAPVVVVVVFARAHQPQHVRQTKVIAGHHGARRASPSGVNGSCRGRSESKVIKGPILQNRYYRSRWCHTLQLDFDAPLYRESYIIKPPFYWC